MSEQSPAESTMADRGPLYNVAGHAVMLVYANAVFDRIAFDNLDEARFVVRIRGVRLVGEPNLAWAYTCLAGPIAARMHTGRWNLGPGDEGATRLARWLAAIPVGDQAKGSGRAWEALCAVEETAEKLWHGWSSVASVAQELLVRRRMTLEDVRLLVVAPTITERRPLVPTADEVLAELDILLRQKHNVDLGPWRDCPREAPMPRATWAFGRPSSRPARRGSPRPRK